MEDLGIPIGPLPLERSAGVAILLREGGTAARLLGAADARREELNRPRSLDYEWDHEWRLTALRRLITPDALEAAWAAGRNMGFAETLGEARQILLRATAAKVAAAHQTSARSLLSQREQEIATLVAQGFSNREIAKRLFISERTADTHVQHVLNKLGFNSRTQIAAWAVQKGLATPAQNQ